MPQDYKPIEAYALVGDCHGAALVAGGDVDWCALGRFDAEPVLFPLLDAKRGGRWSIEVEGATVSRAYEPGTNVLRTVHEGPDGALEVLDFMPVGRREGSGTFDYVTLIAPGWMVRRMRALSGRPRVRMTFRPAGGDWARREPVAALEDGALRLERGRLYADLPLALDGATARAEATLAEGEVRHAVLTAAPEAIGPCAQADAMLAVTRAFWREWAGFCRYDGPHADMVRRSALALKLLTYAPTGAMVAAATTSLPEEIGGARNWDYRFCWVRDSALSLFALSAIGYSGEGHAFSRFLMGQPLPRFTPLQVMYGVHGERALREEELTHLEGYRGSRPVRVGNGAHGQLQIDVFGEMLDLARIRTRLGAALNPRERMLLADLADEVVRVWRSPDAGLWEARSRPRHHAHSKLMAWVALDRAADVLGPRPTWTRAAREVHAALCEAGARRGFLEGVLPFDGEPGGEGMDASLLLAPAHGVPLPAGVLDRTVREVEAALRRGDFVRRHGGADGLAGGEGAFLMCSFWLVDALLSTGRGEEAEALFDRLCGLGNDVGLFAEEADPTTGAHLGNTPQAFTHLALIASAVNLELWRKGGMDAIAGGYADRAGRAAGGTEGWRGLLSSWRQTGLPVRLRSSSRSILRVP